MDEEGIAEAFLDDTAIADVASELTAQVIDQVTKQLHLLIGPGTSLKGPPVTAGRGISQGIR